MIRIVVDSSSDFSKKELKEKNIEFIPLTIMLDEKSYLDGVDITCDELYAWLVAESSNFPKTSQPSPQAFAAVFEDAKENGDEVICILLSSALSGTCQSACIAKEMVNYDNIHIVDSLTATHMIRILAEHADKMRKAGSTAAQIAASLEKLRRRTKVLAVVDTLEYLHRGGRLSKAAATVGAFANLKPVITVSEEGKVVVPAKCMGKNKSLSYLVKTIKELNLDTSFPLYSIYTYGTENTELLEQKLSENGYQISGRMQVGATIGSHVGPGAYGFIYVEK